MSGDSMPQWMQDLFAGWPMIRANLPTFFVIVVLIFGAVWWLLDWRYGGIVSNKDSEIILLKGQRDDYKEKLGGASPDQAKERIDDLEKRLTQLAIRVEPRFLTPEQRGMLLKFAAVAAESKYTVTMVHEGGCTDCPSYAADFEEVLRSAGWIVGNGMAMGLPHRPPLGLALRVNDPKNLTSQESILKAALEAAKISFNLLDDPYEGTELFFTAVRK
jgi:hypothetical protein